MVTCTLILFIYKAGIASADNPEQLLIALEPECASAYCREKRMREFSSKRGDANVPDVFARPGSRHLVIDIGGNECSFLLKITLLFLPSSLPVYSYITLVGFSLKQNDRLCFNPCHLSKNPRNTSGKQLENYFRKCSLKHG